MIALITANTLLEFVSRKVLSELREDGLTKVHPSLWPVEPGGRTARITTCVRVKTVSNGKNQKLPLTYCLFR